MLFQDGVPRWADGVRSNAPTNPAAARNVRNGRLGLENGCFHEKLGVA
jgi:hypothetical protein